MMILPECMPWVSRLFGVRPVDDRRYIPEDILINILSILPADDVIKCRRVCKQWCAITSTPSFVELHLQRGATSVPTSVFVQRLVDPKERRYCVYDVKQAKLIRSKKTIPYPKFSRQWFGEIMFTKFLPAVSSSADGLLAFYSTVHQDNHMYILNPVTKEFVRVQVPFNIQPPCGIYRDPATREYKLLLITTSNNVVYHYYTAGLGTMCLKKLEYSSSWGTIAKRPKMIQSNGCLYWTVINKSENIHRYKIMEFDTRTEGFRILPHPWPGSEPVHPFNMELIEDRGRLQVVRFRADGMESWELKDVSKWAWDVPFTRNFKYCDIISWEAGSLGLINIRQLAINLNQRGDMCRSDVLDVIEDNLYHPILSFPFTKTLVRLPPTVNEKQTASRVLKFEFVKGG